jgi:hypothetical protein
VTYFRNWLTGFRSKFADYLNNQVIDDANQSGNGPRRAAAVHAYAYWFSYIGNVLGTPGRMSGWTYNCIGGTNQIPGDCIWGLGMVDISPQGWEPTVVNATIQDGNYDYLANSIHWAAKPRRLSASRTGCCIDPTTLADRPTARCRSRRMRASV